MEVSSRDRQVHSQCIDRRGIRRRESVCVVLGASKPNCSCVFALLATQE